MSGGRYYFPEIIGNDALSHVAQLSKQTLREGEKCVEIFQKNHTLLYGKPDGQIYLLMKQNSQSIFDLSPNNLVISKQQKESSFRIRKSSENLSTPVKRNLRKYLSDGDTTKEASESTVSETETVIIRQRRIFSPKNTTGTIVKPIIDVTDIADEVSVNQSTTSKSPKWIGDSDANNNECHCLNYAVDETATVDQKFISPNASKMVDNPDIANQESPRSAQTIEMLASLNVGDCESGIPLKVNIMSNTFPTDVQNCDNSGQIAEDPVNNYTTKQDSCELLEESLKIPNLTTNEKHTPSPVKRAKIPCNNAVESQIQMSISPAEEVGIGINPDEDNKITGVSFIGNKMNISPIGRSKTIVISEEKRKSPSPRRNKLFFSAIPRIICSDGIDELDIELQYESEENPSPSSISPREFRVGKTTENYTGDISSAKDSIGSDALNESKVERSPKNLQRKFSPSGTKTYVSSSPTRDKGYIQRKKISPSTRPSKAIISPEALEHQISPSEKDTSISSPNNFSKPNNPEIDKDYTPRNSIKPSTTISPKNSKCRFSPSDKKSCINTSESVPETNSPCKIKGYFLSKISPSVTSLKTETSVEDRFDSNVILQQIDDSDSNVLHWFMNKLTKLISLRADCMNEIFESFSEFQKELNFLFLYVKKIAYVVEKIPTKGQVYITEEFKNVTVDLTAIAHKLVEKFNLWKIAGDSEVQVWIQCFEEIRNMISHNETCTNIDASPVEYMRFLRAYEKDLKSVWKKMDDMKILEDARRSSLLNTTFDFEMLIKLFVKCLIIIGVLKLRSKTSSN